MYWVGGASWSVRLRRLGMRENRSTRWINLTALACSRLEMCIGRMEDWKRGREVETEF